MKKIQITTIILAILLLNICSFSQEGEKWIRKPLKFTPTERATTVKGTVLAGKLVHCYEFKGRKNHQIKTSIISDRDNASFVLSEQYGDPFPYTQNPDGGVYVRRYSGVLFTGTIHEICVNSERGKSNYTLQVTLK